MMLSSVPARLRYPLGITFLCVILNVLLVFGIVGKSYSSFVDTWIESFHVEAGKTYVREGFAFNSGLPSLSTEWTGRIFHDYDASGAKNGYNAYLHYPSGADILSGISIRFFGTGWLLRATPLIINSFLLFVFLNGISKTITSKSAYKVFTLAFMAVHIGWSGLHSFAHWSYAHYALLAIIGILIPFIKSGTPFRKSTLWFLFGLGVFSGFMTYDYFFLILCAPVVLTSVYSGAALFRDKSLWKRIAIADGIMLLGLALSYAIHFYQVYIYLGSFDRFISDLSGTFFYRIFNNDNGYEFLEGYRVVDCAESEYCRNAHEQGPLLGRLSILYDYIFIYTGLTPGARAILYMPAAVYLAVILITSFVFCKWSAEGTSAPDGKFSLLKDTILVAFVSLSSSALWIALMMNHAANHRHVLPRHFYLLYLAVVLFGIHRLERREQRSSGDRSGGS